MKVKLCVSNQNLPGCFACWVPTGRWASVDKLSVSTTADKDRIPERDKTHLNQCLSTKECRKIWFYSYVDGVLPSERSYWRGQSTARSFSHSQEHLCPIRRAACRSGRPSPGLRSEARSPESSRGWMQPPPSPPGHCTPADKPWGGDRIIINVSVVNDEHSEGKWTYKAGNQNNNVIMMYEHPQCLLRGNNSESRPQVSQQH